MEGEPRRLLDALVARAAEFKGVELLHLHTVVPATWAEAAVATSFRDASLFVGENLRGRLNGARVDYLQCFLSESPSPFRSGRRRIGVALVQVATPGARGWCSLALIAIAHPDDHEPAAGAWRDEVH